MPSSAGMDCQDRRVVFPANLLEFCRGSGRLLRNPEHQLAVFGDGLAAVGEQHIETNESRVTGERVDFVGVGEAGERLVPVNIVQRIAIFGGDGVRTKKRADPGGVAGLQSASCPQRVAKFMVL